MFDYKSLIHQSIMSVIFAVLTHILISVELAEVDSQPLVSHKLTEEQKAVMDGFKSISDQWCGRTYLDIDTIDSVYECFRESRGNQVSKLDGVLFCL